MINLPNTESSYWFDSVEKQNYPKLDHNLAVDVVIVGGGITGLTAAYLLKQAGKKVAVLEKDHIARGTTDRTTGKVTSQHNLMYGDFFTGLGEKTARLYGEANQAVIRQVEKIVNESKIDCDWQREDNYVYTLDRDQIKALPI